MAYPQRGGTAAPPNQAAAEIEAFIRRNGGPGRQWYVGIAADPRHRLFSDHNVDEKTGPWIIRDAGSEAAARAAEIYLIGLGCDGGDGGGGPRTRYVYAYVKKPHTRE